MRACRTNHVMQQFHPIIYCQPAGGALGKTVTAKDADEACRKAAARLLKRSLAAVEKMFSRGELEVVAVIKGDPQFDQTKRAPLFPGF